MNAVRVLLYTKNEIVIFIYLLNFFFAVGRWTVDGKTSLRGQR